jgi:hypothetical protein
VYRPSLLLQMDLLSFSILNSHSSKFGRMFCTYYYYYYYYSSHSPCTFFQVVPHFEECSASITVHSPCSFMLVPHLEECSASTTLHKSMYFHFGPTHIWRNVLHLLLFTNPCTFMLVSDLKKCSAGVILDCELLVF